MWRKVFWCYFTTLRSVSAIQVMQVFKMCWSAAYSSYVLFINGTPDFWKTFAVEISAPPVYSWVSVWFNPLASFKWIFCVLSVHCLKDKSSFNFRHVTGGLWCHIILLGKLIHCVISSSLLCIRYREAWCLHHVSFLSPRLMCNSIISTNQFKVIPYNALWQTLPVTGMQSSVSL